MSTHGGPHILELFRAADTEDPFGFSWTPQRYVARYAGGQAEAIDIAWDAELREGLTAIHKAGADMATARRVGGALGRLLDGPRFRGLLTALDAATAKAPAELTLRAQAAELYALPWELLELPDSGLTLGAAPHVILRYEWPSGRAVVTPDPSAGRALLAWSGRGVDSRGHRRALEQALGEQAVEVVELLNPADLAEALAKGAPPAAVMILAHGVATRDGEVGLAIEDSVLTGEELARTLAPYAARVPTVLLCVCRGGGSDPGTRTGSLAQRVHRAGFLNVVASRLPLSVAASKALAPALLAALAEGMEAGRALALARGAAMAAVPTGLDPLSLQLYGRAEDRLAAPKALAEIVSRRDLSPAALSALDGLPMVATAQAPAVAATHVALIAAAFVEALQDGLPSGMHDGAAWAAQREALLREAALQLSADPISGATDAAQSRQLMELTRTPLRSPPYRALWLALGDQERLNPRRGLPARRSELDKHVFERRFLRAWRIGMESALAAPVRLWLDALRHEQADVVRKLVMEAVARLDEDAVEAARHDPGLLALQGVLERRRHSVVVAVGQRRSGKSRLAARLCALLAQEWLSSEHSSAEHLLPVLVDAGLDLPSDAPGEPMRAGALLDEGRRRAWLRLAGDDVAELGPQDEALAAPDASLPTLTVLDGLERWSLSPKRLRLFLEGVERVVGGRHRLIVLSDPSVLPLDDLPPGCALLRLAEPRRLNSQERGAESLERSALAVAEPGDHRRVAVTTRRLWSRLRDVGALSGETQPHDALLWLLGQTLWELRRITARRGGLSREALDALLAPLCGEGELDELRGVLLMALRSGLPLEPEAVLGGDTALSDHLVARYWAFRLREGVPLDGVERARALTPLLGARLLGGPQDRTLELLLTILDGRLAPTGPLAWSKADRRRLAAWMAEEAENEAPLGHESFRDSLRPWMREAALAIRCSLADTLPHAPDDRRLRSLLAWFWIRQEPSRIVAPGAVLRGVALERAVLGGAELPHADLSASILREADLRRANLTEAKLVEAHLERADLQEARLERADLSQARLDRVNLSGAELSGALLVGAELAGAELDGVSLTGADLSGATLHGARLAFAQAQQASFRGADLRFVAASQADLSGADLSGADLTQADLSGCLLVGANLSGAKLTGADLSDADLTDADLTGAEGWERGGD